DVVLRAEAASDRDIRVAMSGNLCRCTGYVGIVRAIASVLEDRRARGIAAVAGAGRTTLGPLGSGHAEVLADSSAPHPHIARTAAGAPTTAGPVSHAPLDFKPQATFEQSFVVHYPIADVWAFFGRVPDVAACLPG